MSALVCRLLMDRPLGLADLKDVHPEVHDSLKKLLAYDGSVEDMELFFQVPMPAHSPSLTLRAPCCCEAGLCC